MPGRLFFALWPDDETRSALHAAGRSVLVKYPPAGRPVPAENLHVTLLFLGNDVSPEQEAAARTAAAAVHHAPFEFTLDIASSFKDSDAWWLGPRDSCDPLMEFRRLLRERTTAAKISTDAKRFTPHVTVLRGARQVLPPTMIKPVAWKASEFVLVRSVIAGDQSAYTVIGRWPLQAEKRMEQISLI